MIGRNVPINRKLVEQRSLLTQLMSHHDSVPSQRLNQRTSTGASVDFFNKIDPERNRVLQPKAAGSDIFASRKANLAARRILRAISERERPRNPFSGAASRTLPITVPGSS